MSLCDQCLSEFCCATDEVACDPDASRGFRTKRQVVRGDTIQIEYDLENQDGGPLDLSAPGAKVWFTIKNYVSDPDQRALAQATLLNGQVVPRDALASGRVRVTIPATVTQGIADGIAKLYYDLQVKDGNDRITTVEKGLFFVDPDVTRATT